MDQLARDLRFAFRLLAKHPGFSATAVVTLALAIGANTAVFSVVQAVFLRPLPYREPDRLVVLWEHKGGQDWLVSPANFLDWRERSGAFEELALVQPVAVALTGGDEPERVRGARVSPGFFRALGVEPALGRGFLASEEEPGADRVAVLAHGLWRRRFAADPAVVGATISLDSSAYKVVGVLPEEADVDYLGDPQVYSPRGVGAEERTLDERATRKVAVIGRLAPGADLAEARAEMDGIAARLAREYPEADEGWGVRVVPVLEAAVGEYRRNLFIVFAAVGLLLAVAAANLANLLLARGTGRLREVGVRLALGADRRRLARQLLTETAVLGLVGGAVGAAAAALGLRALVAVAPAEIMRLDEVRLDLPVAAFTLVLSLLTGLVVGLLPALRAGGLDLAETLREGGGRTAGARRHQRLRALLVAGQTALVVVLLVAGGLMLRSFQRLLAVDPGFALADRLTLGIDLPASKYPEPPAIAAFFGEVLPRMRALPGVEAVGAATTLPLQAGGYELQIYLEGQPLPEPADVPTAGFDLVTLRHLPGARGAGRPRPRLRRARRP
jgi:putative ABC transport system permease protein